MKKSKSENSRRKGLKQLQDRLCGTGDRGRGRQDSLLITLLKNIHSQKILAQWQEVLRSEQEVLVVKIQKTERFN
ncbi:MAG: hypothetical protein WC975_05860 [Phycisphaerae bacterium]